MKKTVGTSFVVVAVVLVVGIYDPPTFKVNRARPVLLCTLCLCKYYKGSLPLPSAHYVLSKIRNK